MSLYFFQIRELFLALDLLKKNIFIALVYKKILDIWKMINFWEEENLSLKSHIHMSQKLDFVS